MTRDLNFPRFKFINVKANHIYIYDQVLKKELKIYIPNLKSVEADGETVISRNDKSITKINLYDGSRRITLI
jgi:hypothetical protein